MGFFVCEMIGRFGYGFIINGNITHNIKIFNFCYFLATFVFLIIILNYLFTNVPKTVKKNISIVKKNISHLGGVVSDISKKSILKKSSNLADSSAEKLKALNKLKEDGLITEEEYKKKRESLLENMF